MKTYGQFKAEIRAQLWPSGEAENLVSAHDAHFLEAMAEVGKWVRCEQVANVSVIDFCKTNFKCGMTVLSAPPKAMIRRLFTVSAQNFCDPVTYTQRPWPEPECFSRRLMPFLNQAPMVPSALPLGFNESDAAFDCKCGRARGGIWSLYRGNIYIAPWIQSVEQVCIEWDGIKNVWDDADPVNEDQDFRKAVMLYVQYKHLWDFGDRREAMLIHNIQKTGTFDEALGDLMWQCEQYLKERETPDCPTSTRCLCSNVFEESGIPQATDGSLVLAHIGQYGNGPHSAEVSVLVGNAAPLAIIGTAPAGYDDYDTNVGQFYHSFLSPYYGAFGDGAEDSVNKLWPTPSSEDYADELVNYLAFFPLPEPRRYYDLCFGLVHVFFLDSVALQDGDPAQEQWLQAKLMLSAAKWKIVALSDPVGDGYASLRLPYKSWGADLLLSAFLNYERADWAGFPVINNGSSGKLLNGTQHYTSAPFVQKYFRSTHWGFGHISVSPTQLVYQYIGLQSAILDSLTLTKT